jgi:tetratricopeptide (TPR) repeat protein
VHRVLSLRQCGMLCSVVVALVLAPGCSGSKESAGPPPENIAANRQAMEFAHQIALQKFIDGSILEAKGSFAQAILEYQDALRYEKNHAIYFALSKNYSAIGKHPLAIEAGREAVRLQPDNLDYRRLLAEVCIGGYEFDSATVQYEEIIRRDSSNLESWYNLARLYQTRKPLKALEVYDHIVTRFGPEWDVYLQIAELCNKLGKYDRAAEALRQMLEIDPSNQELKRNLAQTYVRAGNLDSALAVYGELRELSPQRIEYIVEIAGVHLMKKEYDRAAREFEEILSRDTVAVDTKLRIGELYFGQVQKDSTLAPVARSIFERIRDKHPGDWRAYWFLGIIGSMMHDDSLAVGGFRKVTELANWNADAWVYLSSIFFEKNNFAEVVRVLESAAKVVPDDFRVNLILGTAYSRTGQDDEAIAALQKAHQINAKDVDAIAQLALVYDGMKRFADSDTLYEQALALSPDNDLVLNNFAYSLADRGLQLNRALEMSKRAVAAKPDNTSYLDTIGWIYFRLGDYREAEKHIKKAAAKEDTNAVVYEHLGDVYYKMNEKDQALELWNKALKLDEKNTALREKISRGSL